MNTARWANTKSEIFRVILNSPPREQSSYNACWFSRFRRKSRPGRRRQVECVRSHNANHHDLFLTSKLHLSACGTIWWRGRSTRHGTVAKAPEKIGKNSFGRQILPPRRLCARFRYRRERDDKQSDQQQRTQSSSDCIFRHQHAHACAASRKVG